MSAQPLFPRRGLWPRLALGAAALLAGAACDLSDSGETRHYIGLRLPDSVHVGDSVEALLKRAGDAALLDTLWSGPLTSDTSLSRLPAPHYDGGDADLYVSAWEQGRLFYRTRAEYRRGKGNPKVTDILPPDSLPPMLEWQGPDSLDLADMPPDSALAALFPGMACVDDRDRGAAKPALAVIRDSARIGLCWFEYRCRDRAGNVSRPRSRRVRILSQVDTVPPVITVPEPDTAVSWIGHPIGLGGATCADAKDPAPRLRDSGNVDLAVPGEYRLQFECVDASGNVARRARVIRVKPEPDTVKPVITLRGPDSLLLYDGDAYADSGARCVDDRDGALPVETRNPVDTRKRGDYVVAYSCADSAGNAASAQRKVRVARRPDTDKPLIVLKGPDTALVYEHEAYRDSGAVCLDARDGVLPVEVQGTIDTGKRGLQTLVFACADSAGNAARADRVVRVARRPDTVKPVLALRGPDSLQVWQGAAYADSGATCVDDRDGALPVQTTGSINTAVRGLQTLAYQCADSAGNAASLIRKVLVARVPDTVKPVLVLRGAAAVQTAQGKPYSDAGADCTDDRDGALPVKIQGSVNTSVPGIYVLGYACSDSAGNAAAAVTRSVTVFAPDTAAPVITLAGPDTMLAVSQAGFIDPGGSCRDSVDGVLPLTLQGISPPVTGPGWYQAGYACADKAGNVATKKRAVKIGLVGTALADIADTQIDTTDGRYNVGASSSLGFVVEPNGHYFAMIRFDLSKANKAGLKSAKLHFFTFLEAKPYSGGFAKYTFNVYRVTSDWVEGTGDWFYHDGGYQNKGDVWNQYYPLTDSLKAVVTNPAAATGVTGASKAMVRDSALASVSGPQSDSLYFGPWCGNPDQIPYPDHLTPLELDVTDYVKTADPAKAYGFVIKVYGVPPGMQFGFTTREAGGAGQWAPRLLLEY